MSKPVSDKLGAEFRPRARSAGFSIVELSIALGVLSIIVLGVGTFAASLSTNMHAMEAVGSRAQLESRIRGLLANYQAVRSSAETHFPGVNAGIRRCIVPNDGQPCQANTQFGFRLADRTGSPAAGQSLAAGVPYTDRGDRAGCGATHSQQCPIVAWVRGRAYCPTNAATCETAAYIEFTYRIEMGSNAYSIRGLPSQAAGATVTPGINAAEGFVILDTRLAADRDESRCPQGNAEIGRDPFGRAICDQKCSEGYVGTGSTTTDPSGKTVNSCVPDNDGYCPQSYIFLGFNNMSQPICRLGCLGNQIQVGWKPNGDADCLNLNSSAATCPSGQIQIGFNPDGSVKCKVPGTACQDVSAKGTCPTGTFAVYMNPEPCEWSCTSKCSKKGGCKTTCAADCSNATQSMKCCTF